MRAFIFILGSFLFIQCGVKTTAGNSDSKAVESAESATQGNSNPLLGSWTWQHSKLCQRNNPAAHTPRTCNCEINLIIQEGKVTQIKDGSEEWSVDYTLEKISEMGEHFPFYFNSAKLKGYVHLEEGRLEITQCPVDGEEHVYVR